MAEPGNDRVGLGAILAAQRAAFVADGPPPPAVRHNRIDRLSALLLENTETFAEAMGADFGTRSRSASLFTEIIGILPLLEYTRSHTAKWMKPGRPMRGDRLLGLRAEVQPSPLGVAGIIGPWNFPVHLVVLPAAAAFAAGNRVMIKMSEITARTGELMAELAPRYFDETELAVVTGGPEVAAEFAGLPFDHLFFTGSPEVGKRVQAAAAANLVPVTLELGGKNPVVVAPGQGDADIARAGARIATARMVNGGQVVESGAGTALIKPWASSDVKGGDNVYLQSVAPVAVAPVYDKFQVNRPSMQDPSYLYYTDYMHQEHPGQFTSLFSNYNGFGYYPGYNNYYYRR